VRVYDPIHVGAEAPGIDPQRRCGGIRECGARHEAATSKGSQLSGRHAVSAHDHGTSGFDLTEFGPGLAVQLPLSDHAAVRCCAAARLAHRSKPWGPCGSKGAGFPAVNVATEEDKVHVLFFAPGIDPATLDVSMLGNVLTVKGRREVPEAQSRDGLVWIQIMRNEAARPRRIQVH
jgi:hypothetical protein